VTGEHPPGLLPALYQQSSTLNLSPNDVGQHDSVGLRIDYNNAVRDLGQLSVSMILSFGAGDDH
jgi:hypothetical protein